MSETLQEWLDELQAELLLVNSGDANTQANTNMWTFALNEENLRAPSLVGAFVEGLRNVYASKNPGGSMLFYIWHDEMQD